MHRQVHLGTVQTHFAIEVTYNLLAVVQQRLLVGFLKFVMCKSNHPPPALSWLLFI